MATAQPPLLHPRFAFVHSGPFSHINEQLRPRLASAFGELRVDNVDWWQDVAQPARWLSPVGLLHALCFYPRQIVALRSLRLATLRTPFMFHRLRERARQRISGPNGELRFTFQTQSLFDASVPGVPHFVFTDHTHLANLRYPAFDRRNLFPRRWTSLEREIYDHARHVFVMSEHVRASLIEDYGLQPDRVSTVYGGCNFDPTPAPLENDGYRNQTVVFVGIDWQRKGGPALAEAFRQVVRDLPRARLLVVGCRPGLNEPWCDEVGEVPSSEVKRHLVRSSVFCLPTRIEPFGIAPIEAFSQRLPAVVSNIGAMPSIVTEGESGSLVPVDDVPALAGALRNLLTDPDKCRRWGEAGRQAVESRFSWDIVARKIHEQIVRDLGGSAN